MRTSALLLRESPLQPQAIAIVGAAGVALLRCRHTNSRSGRVLAVLKHVPE